MLPSENPVAVTKFFRSPRTGLEPVSSWLTVTRSTCWTTEEYLTLIGGLTSHAHIKLVLFNRKEQTVKEAKRTPFFLFLLKRECALYALLKTIRNYLRQNFLFIIRRNFNKLKWWERLDSNQRSITQRVYSPHPLPLGNSPI